jgi:uncharacterized protein YndB with AHSA1/START domain
MSILSSEFHINAPLEKVWDALTNPVIIKQYFFGTDLVTSWKVGEPILWRGAWEGVSYEDKGAVLEFEPLKRLKYNYWSSMSGTADVPENYADITYEVEAENGATRLIITQTGLESEEKKAQSEQNWKGMMAEMEALLEEK